MLLTTDTRYVINDGAQGKHRLCIKRQEGKIILQAGNDQACSLPWRPKLEEALKGALTLSEEDGWQVNGEPIQDILGAHART